MSRSVERPAGETVDAVVEAIAETAPSVRNAIADFREYLDAENPCDEEQLAADVRADQLFAKRLLAIDGVATYASEERESLTTSTGHLHVAMDPLDGSSNLDPNSPMGTIFGVYDVRPPTTGRNLLAAGFVVYGPVTTMIVARDDEVAEYVINEGRIREAETDLTLPADPTVYGFGGGVEHWDAEFTDFAAEIREELKLRYGGAMVADVNQVLTYGGLFSYPRLDTRPEGKLRLQFEGQPMAYIVESAGGRSSDGQRSLLDVETMGLHQRTPLHLGNTDLIERLEAYR